MVKSTYCNKWGTRIYGENHMNIKKIIGVGVGLVATGFGVYKLLSKTEPQKYSSTWFETVSDEVLNTEREIVRKQYCSAGDEIPHGPSYHREHGYNLVKED